MLVTILVHFILSWLPYNLTMQHFISINILYLRADFRSISCDMLLMRMMMNMIIWAWCTWWLSWWWRWWWNSWLNFNYMLNVFTHISYIVSNCLTCCVFRKFTSPVNISGPRFLDFSHLDLIITFKVRQSYSFFLEYLIIGRHSQQNEWINGKTSGLNDWKYLCVYVVY